MVCRFGLRRYKPGEPSQPVAAQRFPHPAGMPARTQHQRPGPQHRHDGQVPHPHPREQDKRQRTGLRQQHLPGAEVLCQAGRDQEHQRRTAEHCRGDHPRGRAAGRLEHLHIVGPERHQHQEEQAGRGDSNLQQRFR